MGGGTKMEGTKIMERYDFGLGDTKMAGLRPYVKDIHPENKSFESGFTGFRGLQRTSLV
jgi:hypothetical protein